jgi:hypothetical protein
MAGSSLPVMQQSEIRGSSICYSNGTEIVTVTKSDWSSLRLPDVSNGLERRVSTK